MTEWTIYPFSEEPANYQMALDEAVFRLFVHDLEADPDKAATGYARFYRISPPAVTIGYRQDFNTVKHSIVWNVDDENIIRRITGGGAVYHNTDLVLSMVFCDGIHGYGSGILPSYRFVAETVKNGLSLLGLDTEMLSDNGDGSYGVVCFDKTTGFELEYHGRKILGCALRRHGSAILVQGSIVLDGSQSGNDIKPWINVDFDLPGQRDIADTMKESLRGMDGAELLERDLPEAVNVLTQELLSNRYRLKSWNSKTTRLFVE
jgi:lipoate-protein ligase A